MFIVELFRRSSSHKPDGTSIFIEKANFLREGEPVNFTLESYDPAHLTALLGMLARNREYISEFAEPWEPFFRNLTSTRPPEINTADRLLLIILDNIQQVAGAILVSRQDVFPETAKVSFVADRAGECCDFLPSALSHALGSTSRRMGIRTFFTKIHPGDLPAIKVAEAAGFTLALTQSDPPFDLYRLPLGSAPETQ
jgi:RimJ/RimL family protein N-acetyltransferase